MSKTPEEMAEEYCNTKQLSYVERLVITKGFIDGYQAAKDEYKVAIDTYNDVAKQMLEEAVRIMSPKDQLADADKVMNSPEKPDPWVRQFCVFCNDWHDGNCPPNQGRNFVKWNTNLPMPAKWISVKDRLPSCGVLCAWISDTTQSCIARIEVDDMHPWYEGFDYWCELPEAPEEA